MGIRKRNFFFESGMANTIDIKLKSEPEIKRPLVCHPDLLKGCSSKKGEYNNNKNGVVNLFKLGPALKTIY